MTIDQLRYFVELARFEHVGKAAVSAHISPSALSTAVTSLERELGRELFSREGKRLYLSEDGKRFLESASRVLADFNELPRSILGTETEFKGNPRIGASHFLASHVVTPAWTRLQKDHPNLSGEISSLASVSVLSELVGGALDFGLVFSPHKHPELDQRVLYEGRLVLAVRKGHPLTKLKGKKILQELEQYPAVIHKGRPGVDLCEAHPIFEENGITPRVVLAFDNDDCAVEKVSRSDAWTMIPDIVLKTVKAPLVVLPFSQEWEARYTVTAVFRKNRLFSEMYSELCELIKEELGT